MYCKSMTWNLPYVNLLDAAEDSIESFYHSLTTLIVRLDQFHHEYSCGLSCLFELLETKEELNLDVHTCNYILVASHLLHHRHLCG